MNPLQVGSTYLVSQSLASLFDIVFPIVVAVLARRALRLSWKYFFYGVLIFVVFQLITRVPLVQITQAFIGPQLRDSRELQIVWLFTLALTAGLFEEIGRWLGYRVLMRKEDKTWDKGVFYGIGHGAIESILLVGGLSLLTVINLAALSTMNLDALPLPADQKDQVVAQIAAVNALPAWLPLLGAYERAWAMAMQVGFSILVLQCFTGGGIRWLWIAIALHTFVDFVAAGLPLFVQLDRITTVLLQEALVTVFGVMGLWIVRRFKPTAAPAAPASG